jgi:hypothetical protein
MLRVLIRALPEIGTGKAVTLGMIEIRGTKQLSLPSAPLAEEYTANLMRPIPSERLIWRQTILVGFDRKKLSPYDLLFQVLRNSVQARTLSPSLAREEPFEPPACLWWQDPNLSSPPAW